MPPNQPSQNPYDFITNPGAPQRSSGFGGDSMFKRVLIVAGGLVILMIIAAIVMSLLSSGSKGPTQSMKELVITQQEIALMADKGSKDAVDPSIRAKAITANLSLLSSQAAVKTYLDKSGAGVDKKLIPTSLAADTATTLDTAKSLNRFDESFNELLETRLSNYQKDLQAIYDSTNSEEAKKVIKEAYTNASTLLSAASATE